MEKEGKVKVALRQKRAFSATVRKQVVKDIESGKSTVTEASRELAVSTNTIYRWLHRYSRYLKKNLTMVIEDKSEAYRTKQLEEQIKELQAALGRKQLEIEYLNKLIELAGEEYKADIKKNFGTKPSGGTRRPKGSGTDIK